MSDKKIEYSHGCIVKLRVENFMHYTDQTIEPLPGFNVIIGHNGSGKSALINAICIGLGKRLFLCWFKISKIFIFTGGDIDTLQRCDNINTFVKRGAKEAKITIELHNNDGDNWVVGSSLNDKGKMSWSINGERTNKAQVLTIFVF